MSTRAATSRCSAQAGASAVRGGPATVGLVASLALLGCEPVAARPDAGPTPRPVVDVPAPPMDVPVDRAHVEAPRPNPLLADLPPIPRGAAPPGFRAPRRLTFPRPWASAWTDNAAIRRLASSCRFQPPVTDSPAGADLLRCDTDIAPHTGAVDPCFDAVELPCRLTCGRDCRDCDATCRDACAQCRVPCTTPACVYACARTCGGCLQACINAKHHCFTAGCSARYRVCRERLVRRYREGGCAGECLRCYRECSTVERGSGCFDACLNRSARCDAEGRALCEGGGPGYGQEELEGDGAGATP